MEERLYDIWAASLQDGYIGRLVSIVEAAGGARNIYNMKKEQMVSELGITQRLAKHIETHQKHVYPEEIYERMQNGNIRYIDYKDAEYPTRLQSIESKPYGLFVKGELPGENRKNVAIVGARECTEYGRVVAEYFGDRLARQNINIISGMAWGIDGIAQMAAVKANGNSYAVLGCGADIVYPANNYRLYEQLITGGNGVISEYAPGTKAMARLFPPRNRIIAALCDVLVVVEARAKSGTLITVDMAIEQGRTVMVVPGRITDSLSVGCLKLIKEGATVAYDVDSIMEELGILSEENEDAIKPAYEKRIDVKSDGARTTDMNTGGNISNEEVILEGNELLLYRLISLDPVSVDTLSAKSGLPLQEILVILTKMEVIGCIKESSNGYFVRRF